MKLTQFPIALGCMGLIGTWNAADMKAENERRAIDAFGAALESGITFFDHADIYGGGTCEEVFAQCLAAFPDARDKIQIATKGTIGGGVYNASQENLEKCIERSLRRMKIEHIDLYQVHRPDPFTHPRETARVLDNAVKSGKIGAVGVSNYFPEQVRALQTFLETPLVSNQIEISLERLDPIYEGLEAGGNVGGKGLIGDGTLDQCMAMDMTPLAWSPLGGGKIARGEATTERQKTLQTKLKELSEKLEASPIQIALSWLLSHPAGILPLVGSANPAHICEAAQAAHLRLSRDDWFALWSAAWGRNPP